MNKIIIISITTFVFSVPSFCSFFAKYHTVLGLEQLKIQLLFQKADVLFKFSSIKTSLQNIKAGLKGVKTQVNSILFTSIPLYFFGLFLAKKVWDLSELKSFYENNVNPVINNPNASMAIKNHKLGEYEDKIKEIFGKYYKSWEFKTNQVTGNPSSQATGNPLNTAYLNNRITYMQNFLTKTTRIAKILSVGSLSMGVLANIIPIIRYNRSE